MDLSSDSARAAVVGAGTVLDGTYELTELLGQGGMGAVWKARHLRIPKEVAVKVLLQAAAASGEALARFRREAEVASLLGHPHIVEVLDFNAPAGGAPYLVLELLTGESLRTRLTSGPLPLTAAIALARQIASALDAAHRHGIVHRDLKPENVFLCPRPSDDGVISHVKVLDFGISKIQGSGTLQTGTSVVLGTPQYMAPEQAQGKNDLVDRRADQFALAAIVFEMLTGRPAFQGESLAEVVYRVVYEPSPRLAETAPGLPAAVVEAVTRGLAKDPEERYPDIASFAEALSGRPLITHGPAPDRDAGSAARATAAPDPLAETALSERGIAGESPAPPRSPQGAAPRRSAVRWIAAALLLAGGTAMAIVFAFTSGDGSAGGDPPQVAAASAAPDAGLLAPARDEPAGEEAPEVGGAEEADVGETEEIVERDEVAEPAQFPGANQATGPASEIPLELGGGFAGARPRTPDPERRPDVDRPAPALAREVAADLAEAERAIHRRDFRRAVLLGQRALRSAERDLPEAFELLVRAHCGQRDLMNARTYLRRVPKRHRARVIRACRDLGMDWDPGP